jgi:hypothetical protein
MGDEEKENEKEENSCKNENNKEKKRGCGQLSRRKWMIRIREKD